MAALTFRKATKEQARLRLALFGPSGSGKTYTALRLATGMGGRIAVIDTERGSASKYADRFDFDVLELPQFTIETYCQAIDAAAGYAILIIDSLTHGWHELLAEVDKIANAKYRGNTWSAWSEGTPKQRQLVDALLSFDGHIIATMRTRTEWTIQKDQNGRAMPTRVGLAPEQGKGIEYEFDLLMELSPEHVACVIKDRTGKFQDKLIDKPGEDFGAELAAWLKDGVPPREPEPTPQPQAEPSTTATAERPASGNGHNALSESNAEPPEWQGQFFSWLKQAAEKQGLEMMDDLYGTLKNLGYMKPYLAEYDKLYEAQKDAMDGMKALVASGGPA